MSNNCPWIPDPPDFDMPPRFVSWRPQQREAVGRILSHPDRLLALNIPTGVGKSLVYMAGAVLLGGRTVVLTSTKALQRQLLMEFSSLGAVEVRGRGSYPCRLDGRRTADEGVCRAGVKCPHKEGGCYYQDAITRARSSSLVVTNYAFWMVAGARLGRFDTLVLDEGHAGPEWLYSHLSVSLDLRRVSRLLGDPLQFPELDDLAWWTCRVQSNLTDLADELIKGGINPESSHVLRTIERVRREMEVLGRISLTPANLVIDQPRPDLYQIDPIKVGGYAEPLLFHNTPRVVVLSSTLSSKTLHLLGQHTDVLAFASPFPVSSRPVYIITTVGLSHRSSSADLALWLNLIRQAVGSRSDRKGILHTVSYDRASHVVKGLNAPGLISHDRTSLRKAVEKFKTSSPPALLVSPALSTGYDFPGEECRYQIIGKVAFPDNRSPIQQARAKVDPMLPFYQAVQELIQTCGRGVRSMDDYCENIVIDRHADWLLQRGAKFVPPWFSQAVKITQTIPKPTRRKHP
jgi:ATP-dependent DNA helicase DinG